MNQLIYPWVGLIGTITSAYGSNINACEMAARTLELCKNTKLKNAHKNVGVGSLVQNASILSQKGTTISFVKAISCAEGMFAQPHKDVGIFIGKLSSIAA